LGKGEAIVLQKEAIIEATIMTFDCKGIGCGILR